MHRVGEYTNVKTFKYSFNGANVQRLVYLQMFYIDIYHNPYSHYYCAVFEFDRVCTSANSKQPNEMPPSAYRIWIIV